MVCRPLPLCARGGQGLVVHPAANFIAFQLGWFACVLGAANGMPWLGVMVTALVLTLNLCAAKRPRCEIQLIVAALALGLVLDSALVAAGWLAYPNGQFAANLAPYWILAMWALFASTLNFSMRWLHDRYLLAALFGGIGGPMSYWAGARLGAVQFSDGSAPYVALAVAWAVVMPVLMGLAKYFDRITTRVARGAAPTWILD